MSIRAVTTPSNGIGLRRIPQQKRSRDRVDAALGALVELVREVPLASEITTTDVAERAGLPIGSLYVYFEDLGAIVDAAVARMLDRHDEIVGAAMGEVGADPAQMVDRLLDAYVRLHREEPGFMPLRDSTLFQPYHLTWYDDRVAVIIERVMEALWGHLDGPERERVWERMRLVFALGDAALFKAFQAVPTGDEAMLEQAREILHFAISRVHV